MFEYQLRDESTIDKRSEPIKRRALKGSPLRSPVESITHHSRQTFLQHIHRDLHHGNAKYCPVNIIYSSLYLYHDKFFLTSNVSLSCPSLNPFLLIYSTTDRNSCRFSTQKYFEVISASSPVF